MKIASVSYYPLKNTKKINKNLNENKKEELKNNNSFVNASNLHFSGLFSPSKKAADARCLMDDCYMKPNEPYLISDDSIFYLGQDCVLDLNKEKEIKAKIENLKPLQSIILGRGAITSSNMDMGVSREHLQIKKNIKGELVAIDLKSTNGTKICKNVAVPDLSYGSFKFEPHVKYVLPKNSVLKIGNNIDFSVHQFRKQIEQQEEVVIGRALDVSIRTEDSSVSRKHLKIKNYGSNVMVEDLGSSNGTQFSYLQQILNYDYDFSKIYNIANLQPNSPTLIPNDCQLYLGNDFTIDVRNSNILDLLDEKASIVIGRNPQCDVVIDGFYNFASSTHLKLEKIDNKIIATDLGSTNGTKVVPKNEIKPFYCSLDDIHLSQNNVGDCFLLSTIYAMSRTPYGRELLEKMVRVDEAGNYIVTFKNQEPIAVASNELDGQTKRDKKKISVSGDLGIKAIERAYGKLLKKQTLVVLEAETMFSDIDQGGQTSTALEKMTGIKSKKFVPKEVNIDEILTSLYRNNPKNYILTCSTYNRGNYGSYMDPERRFNARHAYAIDAIDAQNRLIKIINPHNTLHSYFVTWDEFKKYFDCFFIANAWKE